MLLDPTSATDPRTAQTGPRPPAAKLRLRFRKDGLLRLVSHHDLMHVFERLLRRADIPFRSTQGFHPQPRIVFALSLALGVVGCDEVVEIELEREAAADEVYQRLTQFAPPGLQFLSARAIDVRRGAQALRVQYRVAVPAERHAEVSRRIDELLATDELWVERSRPRPRRMNLRPYLHALTLSDDGLQMSLWVSGSSGTARPEEILTALGLADLVEAGAVFERTAVELRDELPETEAALFCEPEADAIGQAASAGGPPVAHANEAHRPAPLLPGPLSFDS